MSSKRSFVYQTISVVMATFALLACDDGEPAPQAPSEPVRAVASAVVGGEMVSACQWPSTVDVNGCTGTLIHSRVVVTAAHCLSGTTSTIRFGGARGATGSFTVTGTCHGGARGSTGGGTKNDWAYCVLPDDERVKALPITPPLVGCEAEKVLKAGATAWVVGYGSTGPSGAGAGVKRQVAVKINRVANGIVDVGDRDHGACHGDSGGPLYMQVGDAMHDWGWRVAGSTSSAGSAFCDCTCNTIYVDIANHVAAIEQMEEFDVSPCTDENGDWDPSPACAGFMSAPQEGSGTFPDCSMKLTTDPIETCGANDSAPDAGAASGSGGSGGTAGSSGSGGSGGSAGSAGSAGIGGSAGSAGVGALSGAGGAAGATTMGAAGSIAGAGGVAGVGLGGAGSVAPSLGIAGGGGAAASGAPPFGAPGAGAGAAATGGSFPQSMGFPVTGIGGSAAPTSAKKPKSGCTVSAVGADTHRNGLGAFLLLALCPRGRRRRREA
jgi:hypothetical protein